MRSGTRTTDELLVAPAVQMVHSRPAAPPPRSTAPVVRLAQQPRCAVFDPSPAYRRGLCSALRDEGLLVQELEAPPAVADVSVDDAAMLVMSLDVGHPPPASSAEVPACAAVGLLANASPAAYADALLAGWRSLAHRDAPLPELVDVVRAALAGRTLLPQDVLQALLVSDHPAVLSPRQRDEDVAWLRALRDGRTVAQLGKELGYCEREMYRRLHAVYGRLGVSTKTAALVVATRRGLI